MLWLFKFLPKNHLSFIFGLFMHLELPRFLKGPSIRIFAGLYNIDLNEAEKPLEDYRSIGDFFVRRLKPGARPLGSAEVLNPADALVTQAGPIAQGRLIQAKGRTYSAEELIHEPMPFQDGFFLTYYLCPTDYHRVHSPVDAEITETVHIPGSLWPVNQWSVDNIPDLFSVNERVIVKMQTPRGLVMLVFVGATNVVKIELAFDTSVATNDLIHKRPRKKQYHPAIKISKGQELGLFRMGSTVVMLYPQSFALDAQINNLRGKHVRVNSDLA
jgi:phosphatidylserine decarboxylase